MSTGDGAAAADTAKRCGASITKVPPASYGGPPQEIQRALAGALRRRRGGRIGTVSASGRTLKACAAVLERLAATDPATGPRVLDFDLSLDDPTTCLRLDAATLRALALVDDDSVLALLRGHAATAAGRKRLEAWLRRPLADVPTLKARQAAVAALVDDETARQGTRRALKHRSCADADRLAAAFARESIPLRDLVAAHALRERLVSCAAALDGDGLRDVKQAVGRAAKSLEKLALLVEEVVDVEALPRVSGVPVSRRDKTPSITQAAQGAHVPLRRARPSVLPPRRRRGRVARGRRRRRSDPVSLAKEAREARQDDAEAETRARRPAGPRAPRDEGRRRGGAEGLARDAARDAARRRGAVHDEGRRAARLGPARGVERVSVASAEILRECSKVAGTFRAPLRNAARLVGDVDALLALAECASQRAWTRPTVDGKALTIEGLRHPLVDEARLFFRVSAATDPRTGAGPTDRCGLRPLAMSSSCLASGAGALPRAAWPPATRQPTPAQEPWACKSTSAPTSCAPRTVSDYIPSDVKLGGDGPRTGAGS